MSVNDFGFVAKGGGERNIHSGGSNHYRNDSLKSTSDIELHKMLNELLIDLLRKAKEKKDGLIVNSNEILDIEKRARLLLPEIIKSGEYSNATIQKFNQMLESINSVQNGTTNSPPKPDYLLRLQRKLVEVKKKAAAENDLNVIENLRRSIENKKHDIFQLEEQIKATDENDKITKSILNEIEEKIKSLNESLEKNKSLLSSNEEERKKLMKKINIYKENIEKEENEILSLESGDNNESRKRLKLKDFSTDEEENRLYHNSHAKNSPFSKIGYH